MGPWKPTNAIKRVAKSYGDSRSVRRLLDLNHIEAPSTATSLRN
jgi:hypothetical protein